MRYRVVFVAGLAVGYVLGSRAGRERYEQIKRLAQRVADNPKIQEAAGLVGARASRIVATAKDRIGDKVPFLADVMPANGVAHSARTSPAPRGGRTVTPAGASGGTSGSGGTPGASAGEAKEPGGTGAEDSGPIVTPTSGTAGATSSGTSGGTEAGSAGREDSGQIVAPTPEAGKD
ncbi:hypothetical protein GCM10010106_09670 [Thermopolyspora flexuosa]|jgi:hypothetical protein|uniref:Uncharacterized protein n=1 Tax=Thermopolyspora flexuosa TaxID=103836 RepID=A0A543J082_9ACTN|nr:hypothetical protein FHX40_2957 [Thermopolyspora flexuosa]GGM65745.1 hypothetical protein GCM10010106_09670 [Thermopolyspora flexuosa]